MFSVDFTAWSVIFWIWNLGRTGCQYVCHINYSWLDNRNATSWKNNKINSKANFRYHRKLFVCLFQWHPKKQASKWQCFLYYSSVNSSVVKPVFWHRTEQVENFKRNVSTRVVLVYSVEACTAVCPRVSPEKWGVNWPCIPIWTMGEGWEGSAAARGLSCFVAGGMGNNWAAASCQW